jgi:hypothetical protein
MAISSSVSRQSAAKPGAMTSISPSCDHYGARLPMSFGPVVVTAGFALFAFPNIGGSIGPRSSQAWWSSGWAWQPAWRPLDQLADRIIAFLRERREDRQALLLWRGRNWHALRSV